MRTDEQKRVGAINHYEKYEDLAQRMGINSLSRIVPFEKNELTKAYENGDVHLNSFRLHHWDMMQPVVLLVAVQPMSLSDCVCVLKHVAIYHIVGVKAPK